MTTNTDPTRVNLQFAPEVSFELRTAPTAPFRASLEGEFDRLKRRLLADQLNALPLPELNAPIRRAANEAAAMAWITFFPLLVFPALFDEKVAAARRQARRQARITADTRKLVGA